MAKNANGDKFTAQQMITAIEKANGNLSVAAEYLGCTRKTVYRYVNKFSTVKDALEDSRETSVDFVENKLMKAIKDGNITAMIFFLKTQGKHRGWVERQEITGKDGAPMEINTVEIVKDYGEQTE